MAARDPAEERAETPRQPQRARGHARFEALLNAAEALLREQDAAAISLQDVARLAEAPLASVYHYFPNPSALFLGLAQRSLLAFDDLYARPVGRVPDSWPALCRILWNRARLFYEENPAAMKLFLGPDVGWKIRQTDLESNSRLGQRQHELVRQHFHIPDDPEMARRFALSITISDSIWSLSYIRHGTITDAMAKEAADAREAYLALYIPLRAARRR
ncbi:TetR/AcrR family transcriptional regulator [Roseomonas sp. 18066]|uniref:TetR/AcrR family transcriptional regulator n=1 Tax=Roseomonas sp. 18066 TaxID=2681412 RepID=UPI0013591013|nr:TetR/AcrR family transcriptional regulator [Roseomonas sp. 18066]